MEIQLIQNKIYEIRGCRVMLDAELAELYAVETRILKQAVRRNMDRFPSDFMFELSLVEYNSLRSQIVTLKDVGRGQHSKYLPFVFTEQGVAMLASVLKGPKAIEVNIQIVRAFVYMRQYALSHKDLADRLTELEGQFSDVSQVINYLLKKDDQQVEQGERVRIGFKKAEE